MKPNETPEDQEVPAVSDKLLYGDSSKDLVPYPRKPQTARESRARRDQEQARRDAIPLQFLGPGHPGRIRAARLAQQQQPAPDADQAPATPRRYWQHESDVKHTPAPPKQRDPRNIG